MIELRPSIVPGDAPGDLDEVVAQGVSVHLEVLDDNSIILILEDAVRHVHLRIDHKGKGPIRVWEYESWPAIVLGKEPIGTTP